MGVKKHISEARLSKSNSVDLYRPPALRNNSNEDATATATAATTATTITATSAPAAAETTSADAVKALDSEPKQQQQQQPSPPQQQQQQVNAGRRERRPDRAVYVPRARRSQTTPPTTTTTATSAATPAAAATATATTLSTCNPQTLEATPPTVAETHSSKSDDTNGQLQQQQQAKPKKTRSHRERRERERSKKTHLQEKPTDATILVISSSESAPKATEINVTPTNSNSSICDTGSTIMSCANGTKSGNGSKSKSKTSPPPLRIEDVGAVSNSKSAEDATNKCDNDVRELQRASKEINRSNRRIMKQTFVSDVLEIPEKKNNNNNNAVVEPQNYQTLFSQANTHNNTRTPFAQPPVDSTTEGEEDDDEEEDEDDWENMYDESGDCLDPKILQELTDTVGKCKIELPKMDYSTFHIKQSLLNEEEYPHVLEVSNFPVEFKTPDLLMLFSQYKGTGFDIKWVDDTHALAVFSSSRIAAEVLTMGHPFVKLKPLAEATLESRLKAKKCAGSLEPYRQRPATCTALARRLVSGALGVKLPTAPQERENERRVLREAKERKLLAAKQRDEAWES
ncbi:R3H and coiled-coil domain-containing protein 1 [Scaptodrosophila lebanonensis]|uniref:R3H and coiled-coil domain-containing protein 1 n=1 Tax=Drosophila lebanonensis TaxID=7225 RepID=A0A6J2TBI5_DROLE|nr:R3H and coiled-coil domain-containing protein 1 [Scaptodrosophila lebanonensis]